MVGKAHEVVEEANGRVGLRFHHGWAGLTRGGAGGVVNDCHGGSNERKARRGWEGLHMGREGLGRPHEGLMKGGLGRG